MSKSKKKQEADKDKSDGTFVKGKEFSGGDKIEHDKFLADGTLIEKEKIVTADATVWEKDTKSALGTTHQEALSAHASGGGSLTVGKDGLKAELAGKAEANLYKIEHEYKKGPLTAKGEVAVGASAEGSAALEINPLNGKVKVGAEGEAFIGARAKGEAELDLKVAQLGAEGKVGVGLGIEGKADVEFDHGKFEAELGVGGYLGVGGSFSVHLSLDAGGIWDVGESVVGWFSDDDDKDTIHNNLKAPGNAAVKASEKFLAFVDDFA